MRPNSDSSRAMEHPVIAVDLDGTLLRTDTLVESALQFLQQKPLLAPALVAALSRGRAGFKAWLAERVLPDASVLPLNQALFDWLLEQRRQGRSLVLVSAADQRVADAVAAHLGIFDTVIGSDGERNLKGANKAALLVERYGERGYDYAGDSAADTAVWKHARQAIVVAGSRIQSKAREVAEVSRVFAPTASLVTILPRALRVHQWAKNLLVFLPLLAAQKVGVPADVAAACLAFVAMSLTASAVYLINDLFDLQADRVHPSKRLRPFAAGDLPLQSGLLMIPLLLGSAILICTLLPAAFAATLLSYFLLTSLYSLILKKVQLLDVFTLAVLYTSRVVAGAAALAIMPSLWLLALSMFMFFSLALVKRYAELRALRERGLLQAVGRGWRVSDLPLISKLGVASGLLAVAVLALYVNSAPAQRLYLYPQALWGVCPLLLYWIARIWLKTHRGDMHEDPVVFALRDRTSLLIGVLVSGCVLWASFGLA